jgi:hypothetical protein
MSGDILGREGGLMAFLKETERSLRLYFFVVGAIATLLAVRALGDATRHPVAAPSGIVMLAIWFPLLARLVLGPAFVVAGVTLKGALEGGAGWIKNLVKLAAAVLVVEVFAVTVVSANSIETSTNSAELLAEAMGRALIPLLILWYIHASLWRLAAKAQLRAVDTVARKSD